MQVLGVVCTSGLVACEHFLAALPQHERRIDHHVEVDLRLLREEPTMLHEAEGEGGNVIPQLSTDLELAVDDGQENVGQGHEVILER